MGITFWLKLFGSAMVIVGIIAGIGTADAGGGPESGLVNLMVALSVLVIIVSIGILMHGMAAVLERLDEKGEAHEHSADHTE
ncbi:hypothetical protein [Bhargavaea massiliensis]|uniref:hypothetical protein n=1 Tax=Bhargavaea massiliensis TaxID=2697500 RepID=UPI001BCD0351|nr:hypothetical protein [Bhargavaea massiliensis]